MTRFFIVNDSSKRHQPGDVSIYDSKHAVEMAFEIYDIGDNCITIFDSSGNVYEFEKADEHSVIIIEKQPPQNSCAELELMLREHGLHIGFDKNWINTASVNDLAEAFFKRSPNPYSGA